MAKENEGQCSRNREVTPVLLQPADCSVRNETMKIALHVICAAGYGYFLDWDSSENAHQSAQPLTTHSSEEIVQGHQLSFRDSLQFTLDNLVTLAALPKSFLRLPFEYLKKTRVAYNEFGDYLLGFMELGKSHLDSNRAKGVNSILNALVASSDDAQDRFRDHLTDQEILGNAFIFLLAGHETTYPTCNRSVPTNLKCKQLALRLLSLGSASQCSRQVF